MKRNPNQPTGYVNFQRYFSANEAEANEEADRLEKEAQKRMTNATTKRDEVVSQFNSKAQNNLKRTDGSFTNVGTNAVSAQSPTAHYDPLINGLGYYGDSNLSETAGAKDAYAASSDADAYINALGTDEGRQAILQGSTDPTALKTVSGSQKLSAALSGAAGGDRFAKLRAYFNPQKDWKTAEDNAKALAEAKKKEVESLKGELAKKKTARIAEEVKGAPDDVVANEVRELSPEEWDAYEKRPKWGQFNIDGQFSGNSGFEGAHRGTVPGVFSIYDGSKRAYEGMNPEEYSRFLELYEVAKTTKPKSSERQALLDYVRSLTSKYGKD